MFARSLIKSLTFKTAQQIKAPKFAELFLSSSFQFKKFSPLSHYIPKNYFSSNQNPLESEIETILSEMGKDGQKEFEEPYVLPPYFLISQVPPADLDRIKALRSSINQNITLGNMEKVLTSNFT